MARTKPGKCPETLPLFPPDGTWAAKPMAELPSWREAKRVAIDIETYDPNLKELGPSVRTGGFIIGISFAIEDGNSYYLPVAHGGKDAPVGYGNLIPEHVWMYLKQQAKEFKGEIVGANLQYDLDYLAHVGIIFTPSYFRDVQIAAPLVNELHDSYSLQNIALRLGLPGKDESALIHAARIYNTDPKGGMWKLPAQYVGQYAEQDVRLPLQILRRLEREIDNQELWPIYNLESKLLPVLVKMKRRGVRVNMDELERIENWCLTEMIKDVAFIKNATSLPLALEDITKPRILVNILDKAKIPYGRTPTGEPEITKESLAAAKHPVADALLHARSMGKVKGTFCESIRRYEVNGRIHTTFNQIARETEEGGMKGARWGRMSSSNPNLQQQPARGEFKAIWRKIFIPEEGTEWASSDFSAQEPRWTTHFAGLINATGAKETVQRYHDDPTLDDHKFMADLTGLERDYAKNIFLGLCYGEGGAKLCRTLNLPTRWALRIWGENSKSSEIIFFENENDARAEALKYQRKRVFEAAGLEGQSILDQFNERVPYVKELAYYAQGRAEQRGYVKTVGGRKLHFPQKADGTFDWCYKALNRVIQGSGADQMKQAMINLDADLPDYFMQLQVHDEVCGSIHDRLIANKVAEIMRDAIPASLPFKVTVKIGPSWGEIEKI